VSRSIAAQIAAHPPKHLSRGRSLALPFSRRKARLVGVALAIVAVLGGAWLWLRSSPWVAVERVDITGVQSVDAGPIEAALKGAAIRESTLDANTAALRAAVAPFPVVRAVSVKTSFPHGMSIAVSEQLPVAALSEGGVRTAVAADGVVLGPSLLSPSLAALAASGPAPRSGRVQNATVRGELAVLGAAPQVLLGWVEKVFAGKEGLTVEMHGGLQLYFGDATRPHAKWLAVARVLADSASGGAAYVDVRAPERPASGTTAPSGGGEANASAAAQGAGASAASGDGANTTAVIAHALAEAVTGGPTAAAAPAAPPAGQSAPAGTTNAGGEEPGESSGSTSG
jgi:cell division protein FtsQ